MKTIHEKVNSTPEWSTSHRMLFSLLFRYRNGLDIRIDLDISENHFSESSAHEIFLNLLAGIPCAEALDKSNYLNTLQSTSGSAESTVAEINLFSLQVSAFLG
jgi:hypothetical protein